MVFCPKCGKANPEDAVYCNYCGKEIVRVSNLHISQQPKSAVQYTPLPIPPRKSHLARNVEIGVILLICILMGSFIAMGLHTDPLQFSYTNVEKHRSYSFYSYSYQAFRIEIELKNTGSTSQYISTVLLNDHPYSYYSSPMTPSDKGDLCYQTIAPGATLNNGYIYLPYESYNIGGDWNSGNLVKVTIKTSTGTEITCHLTLP